MSLLQILKPSSTRGWNTLTAEQQNVLLELARSGSDLDTQRMLAESGTLTGQARQTLLAEKEQSIRRRILSRSDLTPEELTTLLAGERRGGVLAALAEGARGDTLAAVLTVALASRGSGLAEQLLAKSSATAEQKARLIHHIIDRGRKFAVLSTAATNAVVGEAGDPKVLAWITDSDSEWGARWEIQRAVRSAAYSCPDTPSALALIDTLAGANSWNHLASLIGIMLQSSRLIAQDGPLDSSSTAELAREISNRLPRWAAPDTSKKSIQEALDSVSNILPAAGSSDIELSTLYDDLLSIEASDIIRVLTGGKLAPKQLVTLACNPNHTDETAGLTLTKIVSNTEASLELLGVVDEISNTVWAWLAGRRATADITAHAAYAHYGHDRLLAILSSPRFATAPDAGRYWRNSVPLLGATSTLAWMLGDTSAPDERIDRLALTLPMSGATGAEAPTFALLCRHGGTDPKLWDAIEKLAGRWEGSLEELLETAATLA